MGTAKSDSITVSDSMSTDTLHRRIKICHDVFSVLYINSGKTPWGVIHEHGGGKLGAIQGFYTELWRVK